MVNHWFVLLEVMGQPLPWSFDPLIFFCMNLEGDVVPSHWAMWNLPIGKTWYSPTNKTRAIWSIRSHHVSARDWPIWYPYFPIKLLTWASHHCTPCLVNLESWLLSYFPKTLEHGDFHILCQIEEIQASLESKWRDLWFITGFGRFWALRFLSMFLIPWITPFMGKEFFHFNKEYSRYIWPIFPTISFYSGGSFSHA